MSDTEFEKPHSWVRKFRNAFRGTKRGIRGQSSFFVHFFTAAMVIAAATVLGMSMDHWCLLLLCITVVLVSEMFNSALETLAKALEKENCPFIRDALDIGSAAVLLASIGASLVGCILFINQLRGLL